MALRLSNRPRPSHSSPSSGSGGKAANSQSGAGRGRPLRKRMRSPSHTARTPSNFSLTAKPAAERLRFHSLASSSRPVSAGGGGVGLSAARNQAGSKGRQAPAIRRAAARRRDWRCADSRAGLSDRDMVPPNQTASPGGFYAGVPSNGSAKPGPPEAARKRPKSANARSAAHATSGTPSDRPGCGGCAE